VRNLFVFISFVSFAFVIMNI